MPYKVKIDHPNAGDTDLYIHGLGTFHNGTETTVDDDAWFRFRAGHAVVNTEIGKDGLVTHDPQLGPDLEDLNLPEWISITKVDGASSKPAQPVKQDAASPAATKNEGGGK